MAGVEEGAFSEELDFNQLLTLVLLLFGALSFRVCVYRERGA